MAAPYSDVATAPATKTQLTLYAPPDERYERVVSTRGAAAVHVQAIGDPDEQAEGSIAWQRETHGSEGDAGRGAATRSSGSSSSTPSGGCGCSYAEKDKSSTSSSGVGVGGSSGLRFGEGVRTGGEKEEKEREEQRSAEYEVRTAEPSQLYLYMPPTQRASHVAEANESRRQQGAQRGAGAWGGQTARL
ncbi:hypothetical protein CLOM_g14692 [Closterium sp. NIES-68]|nr:hypothetical protein CLOM_g14692 [Closterium sp. NIES-68]GJP74933.1 hypothetical protein CLOP_g5449 [Closterium sp. NIES-67]